MIDLIVLFLLEITMDLEAKILRLLEQNDELLSESEIAESLGVDKKLIARAISKLEYNGLIETRSGGKYTADGIW